MARATEARRVPMNDLQPIADRYLRGDISAPVAIMEMLLHTADADALARALPTLQGDPEPLAALSRVAAEHGAGCATIAAMLRRGLDSSEPAASVDEGIARTRTLFNDSVTRSEEASVALYSLGSAGLLAAATDEVVRVLDAWGVLGADRDALEIGCGIGRFLVALAPRLRSVVGVDVSENMVAAAQRRLDGIDHARAQTTDGRDLSGFTASSFDLVYSVDAFPYLVLAGRGLVEAHLRDAARVLRPGGDVVIFNYAYGRARSDDARELEALGEAAGLRMLRGDASPFRLWNAIGYHLRRG